MLLKPHQKLVACPFDPQHMITQDRLQRHVLKCMNNYPSHVKCPYNVLHCFLSRKELEEHIRHCPDKMLSQPWRYQQQKTINEVPVHIDIAKCGNEEDWEAEYR
ncbi:U11-48K-like CHHC zinc finger [Popillia japonica]|uniref:U11-48K-like CHHC zinc finger n=1 Tax=Popillia japonica TaxID=7064 RepID=A0AAW1JVI6_POPJA